jgi:hypothetical protein
MTHDTPQRTVEEQTVFEIRLTGETNYEDLINLAGFLGRGERILPYAVEGDIRKGAVRLKRRDATVDEEE